jgi:biopolymer transport protein ExbD
MAHRPSKRSRHEVDDIQPNITPMMNLMVVLIPLLLSTAEFVRLGIIELNLPPAATELNEETIQDDTRQELNLAVTITNKGFYISSTFAILGGEDPNGSTIPKIADDKRSGNKIYDFDTLSEKLWEVKKSLRELSKSGQGAVYPDTNRVTITAEANILYETVIGTMDAARSIRIQGKEGDKSKERVEELFTDVSLSPGVK